MSAVQSVRTSGVLVTTILFFFADSISMLLKPTPKLPMILTFLFSVDIILSEILSVTVATVHQNFALHRVNLFQKVERRFR